METKQTNSTAENCIKWICPVACVGALLFGLYALHDLQTAEGVGLYLSMIFGHSERRYFDLLVDAVCMALFLLVLVLPCVLLKQRKVVSFFRLLSVYLAFMPIVHPGVTVHFFDTLANLTLREALVQGNFAEALLGGFADTVVIFRVAIPLLLLLLAVNKTLLHRSIQKWQIGIIVLEILLLIVNFLFLELAQEATYFMHYGLLVWCFGEWEALCERFPKLSSWGMILFGGCLLRGIYRMIELMSITHL